MTHRTLTDCLACGGAALEPYLDLGEMPLANSFHDGSKELPRYPLQVQVCRHCWHSQLTVAVDPAEMFSHYLYVSGTSNTLREYFRRFAERFPPNLTVLDIGCNDGSLLDAFAMRGCTTIGVEPSDIAAQAQSSMKHAVINRFWDEKAAFQVGEAYKYDVITAFNVLAHTADPVWFLTLARKCLAPGGAIWVQTSQADMVLDGTFDAVYHEHVSYFTPRSLAALARRAGLFVKSIERVPIHGGSMLASLMLAELQPGSSPAEADKPGPLYDERIYAGYQKKIDTTIGQVKAMGVAPPRVGYGAAAKGMTFLNATGLQLDRIVDDNPAKHGLLTPGTNIPIGPVEDLPRGHGIIIVLAWNFFDEIIRRVRCDHGSGHSMLRFFPDFHLVMS